ncbi:MAG: cysteine desulfurase-like protein [Calditrichaceae bacterium]
MVDRRADFPSLNRKYKNLPLAYFDGPGGTQTPQKVINAISEYYKSCNTNTHGYFITSRETDKKIENARKHMAVFLGAASQDCISFGANMTTLNFALSKALQRIFKSGDEIVITELDHEANRAPWLALQDSGIIIREVRLKREGILDYADFESKITYNTKLVAVGMASNALGTVNDINLIRKWTKSVGAYLLVDAVHFAPHYAINVKQLDVDFLLCSAYKFYGPHVGVLYSRPGLLDKLPTDRLRTQDQNAPYKIETGTLNHAALAGVSAAVDYIASVGDGSDLRYCITDAMHKIAQYEHNLAQLFYNGLKEIKGVTVYGLPMILHKRTPTISFFKEGKYASDVCKYLAEKSICAWDGHYYAIRAIEVMGLLEKGGLTRIGMSLYNNEEEINRLLNAVEQFK